MSDFETLVEKYHNLVMSLIRRYYGGRLTSNAEDLSQEVWAKLWENFKKNENNIVNFKSYLYRTVQTTLWDASRSLDKLDREEAIEEAFNEPGVDPNEERVLQKMEVQRLLDQLSPEESRMMRAHLKGFNNGEIADMLGIGEGRVRNLLTRIKKKMADMGGS